MLFFNALDKLFISYAIVIKEQLLFMEAPVTLELTLEESLRLIHLLNLVSQTESVYAKDASLLEEKLSEQLPDVDYQREEHLMVAGSSNS